LALSKLGYYADFVVYPAAVAVLSGAALWRPTPERASVWLAAFLVTAGLWTLVEYGMHRFVFHRVPFIRDMHHAHHNDQAALIGSPTWLSSLIIVCVAFVPLFSLVDFTVASAVTSGLMLGYLWYVTVHHLIHHGGIRPGDFGYGLKRHHMLHHHFDEAGNFGVTSGVWDKVFRTEINARAVRTANR
jgi:sterol desaturase/sphingolipid hydroxylase (fatty acid hydroxylase superfamily)